MGITYSAAYDLLSFGERRGLDEKVRCFYGGFRRQKDSIAPSQPGPDEAHLGFDLGGYADQFQIHGPPLLKKKRDFLSPNERTGSQCPNRAGPDIGRPMPSDGRCRL